MQSWQQILRKNFVHWETLSDFLQLSATQREEIEKRPKFALNLPLRLAEKIAKGSLDDPILKQFLPLKAENLPHLRFVSDPVGDCSARKEGKLLRKYKHRALLLCTSACAMHCRYCFRQNFDYETEIKGFQQELQMIADDPSLHEVILSGGDPLSLSNQALKDLIQALCSIPHIQRIRFHSRFPIGIPERIDSDFLEILQNSTRQIWFVIHANHPKELDQEVLAALKLIHFRGAVLLNQSVLLQGVNDSIETLKQLFEILVNNGILPYYLHQLDPVSGSSHFEVEETLGRDLMQELTKQLSGYAIPKYVKEIAGEASKTSLPLGSVQQ